MVLGLSGADKERSRHEERQERQEWPSGRVKGHAATGFLAAPKGGKARHHGTIDSHGWYASPFSAAQNAAGRAA
jgi:hypothetical protein